MFPAEIIGKFAHGRRVANFSPLFPTETRICLFARRPAVCIVKGGRIAKNAL